MEISPLIIALAFANSPAPTAPAGHVLYEPGTAPAASIGIGADYVTRLVEGPEAPPLDKISSEPSFDSQQIDPDAPEAGDLDVIVVEGEVGLPTGDPVVELNEAVFQVSMAVDNALVEPLADSYRDDFPVPVRKGLRNFFRNLTEPVNFLNFLIQGNPLKAIETFGRFAINTTLGVGGLIDWAKNDNFQLPYRRNGFANTLGYYGVGPGPFLVLPLVGATTLRDLLGGGLDQLVLPTAIGKPFNTLYYAVPAYTVNSLEWRIEFDDQIEEIKGSALPYDLMKEYYLDRREREINALKGIYAPTMDELIEQDRALAEQQAGTGAAQDQETEAVAPQLTPLESPPVEEAQPRSSGPDAIDNNIDEISGDELLPPTVGAADGRPGSQSISSILAMAGYHQ